MKPSEKLAAALRERKGIEPMTSDYDPPVPELPVISNGFRAGSKRPRYSGSQHALLCLESRLRQANTRADKAEAELVQLAKLKERIGELEGELREARKRAEKEVSLSVMRKLTAAWERIEELEEQLCNHTKGETA